MPLPLNQELLGVFQSAFAKAADGGQETYFLSLAGRSIKVLCASPTITSVLLPSLKVLLTIDAPSVPDDLTLCLWTGSLFKPDCSPLYQEFTKYPDKVTLINKPPLHLLYNPAGQIVSAIDTEEKKAYVYAPDFMVLPDYEVCTPLRMIMNWFCRMIGLRFAHAAAVGHQGKAVLIVGQSGAGKSTTALTCLLGGLDFIGDDYVALSCASPITVHALYHGCKVMDDALPRLPEMKNYFIQTNKTQNKNVAIVTESAGRLAKEMRVYAILRPHIAKAGKSSFHLIPPLSVVTEFAGSTILQMPGEGAGMLKDISAVCRSLPCYRLSMSADPQEIVTALRSFLNSLPD